VSPAPRSTSGSSLSAGNSRAALARQHQVDPRTIRRVLDGAGARELPEQLDVVTDAATEQQPEPDPVITLELPGLLAEHLLADGDETVRTALASGRTIRHGQDHSLRITAPLELHRTALQQAAALATDAASPAERKAHRVYATRITAAT
jgi:putative DNA-invertase from lambdoid prophage Rac